MRPREGERSMCAIRTWRLWLVGLCALILAGCSSGSKKSEEEVKPAAGAAPSSAETKETEKKHGRYYGAKKTEYPDWFKVSFLDLEEDIAEAKGAGKRLLVIFHQDGCPYCRNLVEHNLSQQDIEELMKKSFDIVTINMWGDREVTSVGGRASSEKELARELKVQFTPTLIFFDEEGQVALRLNGYLPPARFKVALEYVAGHHEKKSSYHDYVEANQPPATTGELHAEDFFEAEPYDFKVDPAAKGKPLAVFFEQKSCPNCTTLHTKVLTDEKTRLEIQKTNAVQLDMWSDTPVITPDGKNTTARQWAKELNVTYAPSIVLFDEQGEEAFRTEAYFKVFHIQGAFTYVLSGAYKTQPSFQRYLSDRADSFIEAGQDVDIWRDADQEIRQQE